MSQHITVHQGQPTPTIPREPTRGKGGHKVDELTTVRGAALDNPPAQAGSIGQ